MTPRPYRPPSKRRLQVEAWGIFLTIAMVSWCLIAGVWMGIKMLLALFSL
jgi:hypothetical protein